MTRILSTACDDERRAGFDQLDILRHDGAGPQWNMNTVRGGVDVGWLSANGLN